MKEEEENLLRKYLSRNSGFRVYIHPGFPRDIPDTPDLELVIIDGDKPNSEFLEKCGEVPRVYKNTVIFLCKDEDYQMSFEHFLRQQIALGHIASDSKLRLSDAQKEELHKRINDSEKREYEELRKLYRKLYLPSKDGFKVMDMGHTTQIHAKLDQEVYDYLRREGKILEKISARLIASRYLAEKDFIETRKLYEMFLKTPGECMLSSKGAVVTGIKTGVEEGVFGFGYLEVEKPVCKAINVTPNVELEEGEIIIRKELCKVEEEEREEADEEGTPQKGGSYERQPGAGGPQPGVEESQKEYEAKSELESFEIELELPTGKLSTVSRIVRFLRSKEANVKLKVTMHVENANLTKSEYEDKIRETLNQEGIAILKDLE